jgi:Ribonuclease HepT-like
MSPEEKLRLSHIVEAADRIAEYLHDVSKESFLRDVLRQDAVIRRIQIIGEAVRHLSPGGPQHDARHSCQRSQGYAQRLGPQLRGSQRRTNMGNRRQ